MKITPKRMYNFFAMASTIKVASSFFYVPMIQRQGYLLRSRAFCATSNTINERKKIVFLGTPDVAALSLELLLDASKQSNSGFDIAAVVTQPPAPAGRNKKLTPSPVQIVADREKVPVFVPEKAKDPIFLDSLISIAPDLCITAAYGNFLPSKFLSIPKLGTLNIHPSLLPKYRGAAPVQRCLENGDTQSGVSVVVTVLKMDAGPIVRQHVVNLSGDEKATEFLEQMFRKGTELLISCLPAVFDGSIKKDLFDQDELQATAAPKLSPAEACVDFGKLSARAIHNKARGFAGWPGIWSTFSIVAAGADDVRIKIITTTVLEDKAGSAVPTRDISVIKLDKQDVLRVVCADGSVLGILELQPPSKKVMKTKDFVNGLRGNYDIKWTSPSPRPTAAVPGDGTI